MTPNAHSHAHAASARVRAACRAGLRPDGIRPMRSPTNGDGIAGAVSQ